MFRKLFASLGLLSVLLLTGCLSTQDTTTRVPYEEINRVISDFENHHKSPLAQLYHRVWLTREADLSVQLQHHDGQTLKLDVVDGELSGLPLLDSEEAKGWTLVVNQPPWMVRISSGVKLYIVDTTLDYRDVFSVLDDLSQLQGNTSNLPKWYLSEYDKILFSFSSPASIQLDSASQKLTYYSNEGNVVVMEYDENHFAQNGRLHFSQLPQSSVMFTEVDNFPSTQASEKVDKSSF